ncbi:RCS-specific HTH-type transcriptional activator RclR [Usitatibacter rugosus]|uniref:RCS-specific HTH-type transcriptional activator RclR n=1 Tax=Usitatibacter rugosus TaxID=2732067 RepID=A0A6M4H243_9PROT|nr:AraC family transcriptional regulator [Usitatibacter rugosus]QJR11907.1 RCS-specific HTH-type transcriptional activator RclR [Usitatibacter rugosus]
MDALSEVLRAVRLAGAVILNADLGAPWGLTVTETTPLARGFLHDADKPAIFHVMLRGECWMQVDEDEPIRVTEGEALLFPHGHAHKLESFTDVTVSTPLATLLTPPIAGELVPAVHGGGGEHTRLATGLASFDRRLADPLLAALPNVVRVDLRGTAALEQLEGSLAFELTETEAPRPGGIASLARIAELVVIDVIRRHIEATPPGATGWLAGLDDRYVGRALALMHGRPGDEWTVEKLAKLVGLSRSALAEHFTRILGDPPITYLTRWRLSLAARDLANSSREIQGIAKDAGYESAGAFAHAFKRAFGKTPTAWRRKNRRRK